MSFVGYHLYFSTRSPGGSRYIMTNQYQLAATTVLHFNLRDPRSMLKILNKVIVERDDTYCAHLEV